VLGCIMMRVCHLNTCPVGVATQDPELRKRFSGKPEYAVNFFRFVAQEVREHMAALGFRTMEEMIGRVDRLDFRPALEHWKAQGLDLATILYAPPMPAEVARRCVTAQDHGLEKGLDRTVLIPRCREALEHQIPIELHVPIRNVHRTVGTTLGYEVTRRWGAEGLPDDTVRVHFTGSAGQSFGAFVPRGITFVLEGDANDYWGKGLSGGKLIVHPPRQASFVPEENIIIGNVALYGATGGEAYVRGVAGERFAVRNSGAHAVAEGVGDHACEYMTGGRVVVIGRTGRNFAAGMSGGVAYALDLDGDFHRRCNRQMVDLETLQEAGDVQLVGDLIDRHVAHTGSAHAAKILANWRSMQARFVKVMPKDYRRILHAEARARAEGREPTFAELVGATSG
jgi:glutamate synthase (ferredoxin)